MAKDEGDFLKRSRLVFDVASWPIYTSLFSSYMRQLNRLAAAVERSAVLAQDEVLIWTARVRKNQADDNLYLYIEVERVALGKFSSAALCLLGGSVFATLMAPRRDGIELHPGGFIFSEQPLALINAGDLCGLNKMASAIADSLNAQPF